MSFSPCPTHKSSRLIKRRSYSRFVFMPEVNNSLIDDSIAIQAIFESDQPEQWELGKRKLFEHPTQGLLFHNRIALRIFQQLNHMQLLAIRLPRRIQLEDTERLYRLLGPEMDSEAFIEASRLIDEQVLRCSTRGKSQSETKQKLPPLVSAMRKYDPGEKLNCWSIWIFYE